MAYKNPIVVPNTPYKYLCCERNLQFFLKEETGTFFIYVQREAGVSHAFDPREYIWKFNISYFVILCTAYVAGLPLPKDEEDFCCEVTNHFRRDGQPNLLQVQVKKDNEGFYVSSVEASNVLKVLKPWMI